MSIETNYATISELEEVILKDNLNLLSPLEAANVIEKDLPTLEYLNKAIAEYGLTEFKIEPEKIPHSLKYYISSIIPEERVNEWLADKTRFEEKSPCDLLSELDPKKLYLNIQTVTKPFDEVIQSMIETVLFPDFPSNEDLYYLFRLAQYELISNREIRLN